jgi:hypothetical protein
LAAALLATGCDPTYVVRVDVREGASTSATVLSVGELDRTSARPIESARVEVWRVNRKGLRIQTKAGCSGPDGTVRFGPLIALGAWYFCCIKEGYDPVQGELPLDKFGYIRKRTLLLMMRRVEQ